MQIATSSLKYKHFICRNVLYKKTQAATNLNTFPQGRLFDVIPKRWMDPCLLFPKWQLCFFGRFSIF